MVILAFAPFFVSSAFLLCVWGGVGGALGEESLASPQI